MQSRSFEMQKTFVENLYKYCPFKWRNVKSDKSSLVGVEYLKHMPVFRGIYQDIKRSMDLFKVYMRDLGMPQYRATTLLTSHISISCTFFKLKMNWCMLLYSGEGAGSFFRV